MFSALLIFMSACKKNADTPVHHMSATDFKNTFVPKAQSFSVNAATGGILIGAKGTKITIPANAFVDGGGNVVAGTVTVKLTEVLSKKDILFSKVLTEANGQPLESGGELLIKAENAAGNALQINPAINGAGGEGIKVEVPAARPQDKMQIFVQQDRQNGGQQNNLVDNPLTWTPAPYVPFGNGPNTYFFNLPGFQWVNIDRFYSDPRPKTTVTCLPSFQDNNNVNHVEALIIFKDVNTVCPTPFNTSLLKYQTYMNSVPVGAEVTLVILGEDSDGDIQFGSMNITVTAGMHVDVPVKKTTQSEVDSFLAGLQ
jgi:hypothetical protein